MEIIIANLNQPEPTDRELLALHAKYAARKARESGDTFEIDCTLFDIENELRARGLDFTPLT